LVPGHRAREAAGPGDVARVGALGSPVSGAARRRRHGLFAQPGRETDQAGRHLTSPPRWGTRSLADMEPPVVVAHLVFLTKVREMEMDVGVHEDLRGGDEAADRRAGRRPETTKRAGGRSAGSRDEGASGELDRSVPREPVERDVLTQDGVDEGASHVVHRGRDDRDARHGASSRRDGGWGYRASWDDTPATGG
jgi:hypothetical protein